MPSSLRRLAAWWPTALLVAIGLPLTVVWIGLIVGGSVAFDWRIYVEAGARAWSGGELYAVSDTYGWRYSPLLAYLTPVLGFIGAAAWRVLHFAAALATPSWPLRLLTLASWPFWFDVQHGSMIVGIVALAAWALRGSIAAAYGFLIVGLLIPRPIMLPVMAWLLWRRRDLRLPFVGLSLLSLAGAALTGYLDEWVGALLRGGLAEMQAWSNLSPSRILGAAWLPIGVVLASWLTWKGRLGWASLAISPYLLPYYLLFGLLPDPARHPASPRG